MLAAERVHLPLAGLDKEAILRELVDLVVDSMGLAGEREAVYEAVVERENVLSTGIGDGVALPHAKYGGLSDLVIAAGVSVEPVDFGALDGRPANLFFLILGPDSATASHVRVLARLGRLLRDVSLHERLVSAENVEAFLHTLAAAEHAS
jgi:PTS system nitrogen regulatory IIA component